jgi:hypothetical protein
MLRPDITEEKGVVKDGIHIVCGDVNIPYSVVKTIRAYTIEKGVLSMFADRVNSDEDCFDEAVLQRNNWFLYGASKPDRDPYIVDYCFQVSSDGRVEEIDWDETDSNLTRLFSLQYNRDIPTPLTQRNVEEWKMWESIAHDGKSGVLVPRRIEPVSVIDAMDGIDERSVCSDAICKILKMSGFEWKIDECDEGYKLTHNTKDCLVTTGVEHSALGHSCVFVQRSHAILSCYSHNTKKLPKSKSSALWKLLTNEEELDSLESVYSTMKGAFETTHFRVLNPPGYMTKIDDTWVHYTRQQLQDMNSGLFLDGEKKERFIDWWLRDHSIRTFSKIGYYVDTSECPTTVFNTFTGFAAEKINPVELVNVEIILQHIQLLCNHNLEAYEFIMDWLAAILQRPGFLNGICLILKGKHGCGKDMFLSWFGTAIIGLQNYYKTARPHIDLFGAFNSSRKDIVFYHIEEGSDAVFKDVNLQQFKNYITDSYASIQLKQKNTTNGESLVKNYNHFAISTNHVISCETNERRFFGVEASAEKCKQPAYFTALAAAMNDSNVVASFYTLLKNRDISKRNWCDLPETEYMKEMRASSIPVMYHFLEDFVGMYEDIQTITIRATEFYDAYRDWHALHGEGKMKTMTCFGKEIKDIPGVYRINDRISNVYSISKSLFTLQ